MPGPGPGEGQMMVRWSLVNIQVLESNLKSILTFILVDVNLGKILYIHREERPFECILAFRYQKISSLLRTSETLNCS